MYQGMALAVPDGDRLMGFNPCDFAAERQISPVENPGAKALETSAACGMSEDMP